MIIDDYFSTIERSLRQNVQNGKIEEPHYKHIGPKDRLAPADQMSLSQVLAEIEGWLGQ